MRAVAGSLLIVAASVLAGAGIISEATLMAHNRSGNPAGMAMLIAMIVALLGLILLVAGLAGDGRPPSEK